MLTEQPSNCRLFDAVVLGNLSSRKASLVRLAQPRDLLGAQPASDRSWSRRFWAFYRYRRRSSTTEIPILSYSNPASKKDIGLQFGFCAILLPWGSSIGSRPCLLARP